MILLQLERNKFICSVIIHQLSVHSQQFISQQKDEEPRSNNLHRLKQIFRQVYPRAHEVSFHLRNNDWKFLKIHTRASFPWQDTHFPNLLHSPVKKISHLTTEICDKAHDGKHKQAHVNQVSDTSRVLHAFRAGAWECSETNPEDMTLENESKRSTRPSVSSDIKLGILGCTYKQTTRKRQWNDQHAVRSFRYLTTRNKSRLINVGDSWVFPDDRLFKS